MGFLSYCHSKIKSKYCQTKKTYVALLHVSQSIFLMWTFLMWKKALTFPRAQTSSSLQPFLIFPGRTTDCSMFRYAWISNDARDLAIINSASWELCGSCREDIPGSSIQNGWSSKFALWGSGIFNPLPKQKSCNDERLSLNFWVLRSYSAVLGMNFSWMFTLGTSLSFFFRFTTYISGPD